jgi:hypothetical protein
MNYTYDDRDRPFYERVYDLLVKYAGAPNDSRDRESFIQAFTRKEHRAVEYRCCGAFGFGGKFYRNAGMFYVSCYPEDRTRKRDTEIAKVNTLIHTLVIEMKPALF